MAIWVRYVQQMQNACISFIEERDLNAIYLQHFSLYTARSNFLLQITFQFLSINILSSLGEFASY